MITLVIRIIHVIRSERRANMGRLERNLVIKLPAYRERYTHEASIADRGSFRQRHRADLQPGRTTRLDKIKLIMVYNPYKLRIITRVPSLSRIPPQI